MPTASESSRWTVVQYLVTALVWGTSFLFIKIALGGLSPIQVAFGRVSVGAATLAVVAAVTRTRVPTSWKAWWRLALVGLFMCALPFVVFSHAQRHIETGVASILNATTPLMTALVATVALREDRLTRSKAIGLVLAFAGVVVLVAPTGLDGRVVWQLCVLVATLSYGVAMVLTRRLLLPLGLSSLTISLGQTLTATIMLAVFLPIQVFQPVVSAHWTVVASVISLGALGTGVAYVTHNNVIRAWGPTAASTVTYLVPLVAVIIGIVTLGESLSWNKFVGGGIIIAGVLVMQRLSLRRMSPAARSPR